MKNSIPMVIERKTFKYDSIDAQKICSYIAFDICSLNGYLTTSTKSEHDLDNLCKIDYLNSEKEYLILEDTLQQDIWPDIEFYRNSWTEKKHCNKNIIFDLNIFKSYNTLENYVFDKTVQTNSFSKIDDNGPIIKLSEKQPIIDYTKTNSRTLKLTERIALARKLPMFRRAHVMINDFNTSYTKSIQIKLCEMSNCENVLSFQNEYEKKENVSIMLLKLTNDKSCQTTTKHYKSTNVSEHKTVQTNKLFNEISENPVMQDWCKILLNVVLQSFTFDQIKPGTTNIEIDTIWNYEPLWKIVPQNVYHSPTQRSFRCTCNILNVSDKQLMHLKLINLTYIIFKLSTVLCILDQRFIRASNLNIIGTAYFRCFFNMISYLETITSCSMKKRNKKLSNIFIDSALAFLILCRLSLNLFKNGSITNTVKTVMRLFQHKFINKLKTSNLQKNLKTNMSSLEFR